MAARHVADGVGHGQDRQAERQGDAGKADPELGKRGGQYGRAAAAENQPRRADELSEKLPRHM
jgi:hypothetical protein